MFPFLIHTIVILHNNDVSSDINSPHNQLSEDGAREQQSFRKENMEEDTGTALSTRYMMM